MGATLADLLVAQQGISFQDMQSLRRAFKDHLGVAWARTEDTNNVILGQAARHVLVHAAGMVDEKIVRQVAVCVPRTLKPTLERGRPIEFSPDEIGVLTASMVKETRAVASGLDLTLGASVAEVQA